MGTNDGDALILEIGALIVASEEYASDPWVGIAVVGDFSHGQQSMSGYAYLADGRFAARIPSFDVLRKLRSLRRQMESVASNAWHQCLIHVTHADRKVHIQFEYDDPDRWTPKAISRDMSAYANALRPPACGADAP